MRLHVFRAHMALRPNALAPKCLRPDVSRPNVVYRRFFNVQANSTMLEEKDA